MAIMGLLLGFGARQTQSLPLTYLVFLTVTLANTPTEGKYYDSPWSALLIGFAIYALAAAYFWRSRSSIAE